MERKVALLVVYNHRYDKNISRIESLYNGKFSHLYHLVPFYDGDKENVITVYDSSYYFQNYVAQAYQHIKNDGFTHYFVVADDMLLNPKVTEKNLWEVLGIADNDCYISRLTILQERKRFWPWISHALKYKLRQKGVEVENILPTRDEAKRIFDKHGLPYYKIPAKRIFVRDIKLMWHLIIKKIPFSRTLDYPLVAGYSDIYLVTEKEMPKFCQYCGAFAATKLFVEIATPTSLVLVADSIKQDKELNIQRGDMRKKEAQDIAEKYQFKLDALIKDFPESKLYLHPIKLSKWK